MTALPPADLLLQPNDSLKINHVPLWDIYRQLGINYGDHVFARIMDADNESAPLENVTWRKVLVDATKVARVLKDLSREAGEREKMIIGILANSSYTYYVHVVASWLNHWTVLLLSVRNSIDANESLLIAAKAHVPLADSSNQKNAEAVTQRTSIPLLKVYDPDELPADVDLPENPIEVNPVSPAEFKEIVVYIHSSGTSGNPKLLAQSHEFIISDIMAIKQNKSYLGDPGYFPSPLFHDSGLYYFTRWPIAGGSPIPTFIHTRNVPRTTAILTHLKRLPGAVCYLPPVFLEDSLREPREEVAVLKTTRRIFHGGATLSKDTGKRLIEMNVPLVQLYGASEISMITVADFPGPPESRAADMSYVRFCNGQYTFHWEPFDDKLSELIVCPGKLKTPSVINHQDPVGYATNDLWEPHPAVPGLYKYYGRKDSTTILTNGGKTDNHQIELLLLDDPFINGVVVFGTGRLFNGVLLRQDPSTLVFPSPSEFVDAIWPTVKRVNSIVPSHSCIPRQLIILADVRSKPFIQTDKGSIKAKDTLALYQDEIDAAYTALDTEGGHAVTETFFGYTRK